MSGVKELRLLYIHVSIFCIVVSYFFLYTVLSNMIRFKQMYSTNRWTLVDTTSPRQSWLKVIAIKDNSPSFDL